MEKTETEAEIRRDLEKILSDEPVRVVLSGGEDGKRLTIRRLAEGFQAEEILNHQAFQTNLNAEALMDFLERKFGTEYRQINAWGKSREFNLRLAKKGRPLFSSHLSRQQVEAQPEAHNRVKNYLIPEGTMIPPLVDMGILTPQGAVLPSRYDKFRQINRFLEMMDDTLGTMQEGATIRVVDFGCGKSYLTFILYYYLTAIRKLDAQVTGVDLKADVIAHCQQAAKKYGYDGLKFVQGAIEGYEPADAIDAVVSLHACNTATDYALFHAVSWNAGHIFSVPCCQHELNSQMDGRSFPLLTRYGIVQERFAALATDAIRANLLTAMGYRTQLLEFVDLSHTPKNLLIRAAKADIPLDKRLNALQEVRQAMADFHVTPTLFTLLEKNLPE